MRYGAIKKQAVTLPEGGYCLMLGQMESLLAPLATPLGSRVSLFAAAFLAATLIALGSDRCKKPLMQIARLQRYAAPAMILAWLPLVGYTLCVAVGWLKLNWVALIAWQTVGRFVPYLLVAQGAIA